MSQKLSLEFVPSGLKLKTILRVIKVRAATSQIISHSSAGETQLHKKI